MNKILFMNIILAVVWMAISGHFTFISFGFGFLIGLGALWFIREQIGFTSFKMLWSFPKDANVIRYIKHVIAALKLAFVFLYEVLYSGLSVAKLVLSPQMKVKPAIFAYPLTLEKDWEITLLANLITLTPGTLSVDFSADEKQLYIHVINTDDLDEERALIQNGFERLIKDLSK